MSRWPCTSLWMQYLLFGASTQTEIEMFSTPCCTCSPNILFNFLLSHLCSCRWSLDYEYHLLEGIFFPEPCDPDQTKCSSWPGFYFKEASLLGYSKWTKNFQIKLSHFFPSSSCSCEREISRYVKWYFGQISLSCLVSRCDCLSLGKRTGRFIFEMSPLIGQGSYFSGLTWLAWPRASCHLSCYQTKKNLRLVILSSHVGIFSEFFIFIELEIFRVSSFKSFPLHMYIYLQRTFESDVYVVDWCLNWRPLRAHI